MLKPMRKLKIQFLILSIFALCAVNLFTAQGSAFEDQQTPKDPKLAIRNWVYLCAPCHNPQGTGTENGPALFGPKAKRRLSVSQMVAIFSDPEAHGLSEAAPAFRKLTAEQKTDMAIWVHNITKPEDIVIEVDSVKPPPFIFVQNCSGCHAPDATGNIGPNLHNVSKRRDLATIIKLIEDPSSVGVKTKIMPTFSELSLEERTEIANWLITLD